MNGDQITELRNYQVVKSNALIQKSRFDLTVQQQKILLLLISRIKPEQEAFELTRFTISEICEAIGIEYNGKNNRDIKEALQRLSDKSMWIKIPSTEDKDAEVLVRWIAKAVILPNVNYVDILFDEDLKPFLLDLKKQYTQYRLFWTLAMKSKYSIRLYELLKSFENYANNTNQDVQCSLDFLKSSMGIDYERWVDIRRFVIEPALVEINELTDINAGYKAIKTGRSVTRVDFFIISKTNPIQQGKAYHSTVKALKKGRS